jgi:hypothetical protein
MRLFHASQPAAGAAARRPTFAAAAPRPAAAAAARARRSSAALAPRAQATSSPSKTMAPAGEDLLLSKLRYAGVTPKDPANLTPEEAYVAASQVVRERLVDAFASTHEHWA